MLSLSISNQLVKLKVFIRHSKLFVACQTKVCAWNVYYTQLDPDNSKFQGTDEIVGVIWISIYRGFYGKSLYLKKTRRRAIKFDRLYNAGFARV